MSHFFDMSDPKIEGKHIDDRLTAAGHGAGCPACKGVRPCEFKDVLQYDKGTAAGNGAEKNQRQKLHGNMSQPEHRLEDHVYKIQKT